MAKKQHYQVLLINADKSKCFEGRHNAPIPARNAARSLCTAAGEDYNEYVESTHSIIGPAPRTFAGNPTSHGPQ